MAAKDSPLSKTCDGILAKAVFDWKEMIRPDGMLCNKDLEICDSSGRIYPLSIEMKELYLQTQPKNRKITFKFTLHAPTRFVKFEINLDKLFGDKPVVILNELKVRCNFSHGKKESFPFTGTLETACDNNTDLRLLDEGLETVDLPLRARIILHVSIENPNPVDRGEPTLDRTMQDLYLSDELSDLKIVCDGKEFPCHKFILSVRSDVFKTMFLSDLKADDSGTLKINDISAETMEAFLRFVYKDELFNEDITCNLLIAADKYNQRRLVNICVKHLKKGINADNVMEITTTAYLINNDDLLKEASKFIFHNRGTIQKTELWDQIKVQHPELVAKIMDLMVFDQNANKT